MTECVARRGPEGLSLEVSGHATGHPEVCAGASALLYALAGWVRNREDPDAGAVVLEDGHGVVSLRDGPEAWAVFEAVVIGLLQIELAEPGAIRVRKNF